MSEFSQVNADELLTELPGWRKVEVGGKPGIEKTFKSRSYQAGLGLVIRIAAVAEQLDHHPDVTLSYGHVIVRSTSHDVGGLTDRDFDLAQRIERLAG